MWRLSRASYNTIPYYSLLCMYFFFIVSVQFGKKNVIPHGINQLGDLKAPTGEGGGEVINNVYFISFYFFMPRGSAPRFNALSFRILLLTKKGPPSYYLL